MMYNNEGCCGSGHCHTTDDQEFNAHEVMEEMGQLLESIDSILADDELSAEEKVAAIDEMLDPWRPSDEDEDEE